MKNAIIKDQNGKSVIIYVENEVIHKAETYRINDIIRGEFGVTIQLRSPKGLLFFVAPDAIVLVKKNMTMQYKFKLALQQLLEYSSNTSVLVNGESFEIQEELDKLADIIE